LNFDFEGMPEEVRRRLMDMVPQMEIAPSPLVGVIAIAQVAERHGITVELLSIEVREAGALLHWRARFDHGVGYLAPHVSMTDERSTAYRVLPAEGGGDDHSWAGSLAVLPGPPPLATLAIVFENFGADERMRMPGYVPQEPIAGPWEFSVETRDIRRR
jgi:hypothetical protein